MPPLVNDIYGGALPRSFCEFWMMAAAPAAMGVIDRASVPIPKFASICGDL
jgi:hypothetical protein